MTIRHRRGILVAILTLYLLLAVGYGIATPLFETPDEHLHFFTADFIAREKRLPVIGDEGLMGQEAAQPPLYYVLGALLIRPIDTTGAIGLLWPNPRTDTSATAGNLFGGALTDPDNRRGESLAGQPINVNMFVHGPAEAWPWRGYALAAHVLRFFSALIGLGTLLCIHAAAAVVWPRDDLRPLLATALVAFLPQFAFLHGGVNNDTAITFFSAAALWQLLRLRYEPPTPRRYLLLGLTIGLAMLSKAAGILLLLYCLGVLGVLAWARRDRFLAELGRLAAGVALPALLLGGWLLVRNTLLYGDPTAANQFVLMAGGLRRYSLRQVWGDMDRVWNSFFALLGWMNLQAPAWVYAIWNGIVVLAVAGSAAGVLQDVGGRGAAADPRLSLPDRGRLVRLGLHPATILFGWFLAVAAGWLQFMLRTPADQGRLFYPALVSIALGAAYGLGRWFRPWLQSLIAGLALLTSVFCLVVLTPFAYGRPPSVDAVPAGAAPLSIAFPEGLELLGAEVETAGAEPGDWVWVTLYWRAQPGRRGDPPLVHLELFGRDFERVGETVAYHGRGNYPAMLWPEGAIIQDRLAVQLESWAMLPALGRLTVKLGEDAARQDVGTVKLAPAAWPEPLAPLARFGDSVELNTAEVSAARAAPGETVEVRLGWQVLAPPAADLHVFVHLGDPTQPPLAQSDGPAMGGQYPAFLWADGEVFGETVSLALPADLPPGEYPINVGLYDFATGARLPVLVGESRQPTDTFTAGRLTVE
jgi:hypothetical protein